MNDADRRDALYQLAFGYALGVLHAQPPNVSYGVRSEQDAAEFARAYRAAADRSAFTMEVAPAFDRWRTARSVDE
jgi:hypothetical protein